MAVSPPAMNAMQPCSAPRNVAFIAVVALVLSATYVFIAPPFRGTAMLILPANGLLVLALTLCSDSRLRIAAVAAGVISFAVIEIKLSQPLVGATAFALANALEIALACHLLRRGHPPIAPLALMGGNRMSTPAADRKDLIHHMADRQTLAAKIDALSHDDAWALSLLFIDLDNFRHINTTLGHCVGNLVLKIVGGRLRGSVQAGDIVAHLGGDTFAVLLTNARHPTAPELAACRISDAITAPILLDHQDIRIGVSIGVASWQNDIDAEEFLRRAGIALDAVKTGRRGSFQFFDPSMDEFLRRRQGLEQDLRLALAEQAFEVYYQPIIQLPTKEIIAFEALVRWRHATRGLVPPDDFIPLAEEIGLIAPIGDWVLQRACRDAADWPEHVKISVNFSRAQFEAPNAKARVAAAIASTGLPACRLQLEITESTVMADIDHANELLGELQDIGIEIAMDDFGTGYSSLSCLRNCSFDRLKIDRAFIRDLTTSLEARAILAMIVKLATTLGMATTAEGVETSEQFEILKNEGCSAVQGFYISAARPADDVASFFERPEDGTGTAA